MAKISKDMIIADIIAVNQGLITVLVGSTILCLGPGFGVGGKGSSLTTVLSPSPVFPPLGPTISVCPERGTFSPGL